MNFHNYNKVQRNKDIHSKEALMQDLAQMGPFP